MNHSKVAKRAFLSIVAVIALVVGLSFSPNTVNAAVEKTISSAGGSISFTYTTQASITNLSSKPAWLSVSSRLNSSTSVTYTITASANPNCGSRSFDLYFSGTNETYRITQYGLGHSYTVYEKTNPTCSSYGHECFKCARCNSRTQGNSIPPLAHTYTTEKKAATYTATGYEKTYCKVCGHVQKTTTIAKLKETVTYDPNGGTASVTSRQVTHGGTSGKVDNAKRTGYTFAGWYTAKSGGSRVYETTTVTATGNHTLYAHWTANTYTVSFDSQGGSSVSNRTVTFGSTYGTTTNQLTNPKRTGYTFAGWYTAKSGGTFISFSSKVTTASNHTLYAHWTANKYTVYFDNGTTKEKGTVTYGNTYGALSAPTKTGYTLDGWYTAKTGGTKITSSTKVTITADQTLYAHWKANNYTVSFDSQGGSSVSSRTVTFDSTYGTSSNQLTNPSKTGYTFAGWYTEKSGGTKISYNTKVTTAKNHTLYAHWSLGEYTVTFMDGNTKVSTKTVKYNSTYGELPTRTKTGFNNATWYTATSGGSQIKADTKVTITANQTLYARWTAKTITVTLNPVGGDKIDPSSYGIKFGDKYGNLPTPNWTGHKFEGWYTAKDGGTKIEASTVVSNASNHTLYAHWTGESYTLAFVDGTTTHSTKTVTYGSTYGKMPPEPYKSGYAFVGWYTDPVGGSEVKDTTKVTMTANHSLYARWKMKDSDGDGIYDIYDPDPNKNFNDGLFYKNVNMYVASWEGDVPNNEFIKKRRLETDKAWYMNLFQTTKTQNPNYKTGMTDQEYIDSISNGFMMKLMLILPNAVNMFTQSDISYIATLPANLAMRQIGIKYENYGLTDEGIKILEHYFEATGSTYYYDATEFVQTPIGTKDFNEGLNRLMQVCENGTAAGQTIRYTMGDSSVAGQDVRPEDGGTWIRFDTTHPGDPNDDILSLLDYCGSMATGGNTIDAWVSIGGGWQAYNGVCSFDGKKYTLELKYYIQDYYEFCDDREFMGFNLRELGYLVAFDQAKPFETVGSYYATVTWEKGDREHRTVKVQPNGSGSGGGHGY